MKRLLVLLILLAAVGYAGWPIVSIYQIYKGLKPVDEPLLTRKVDWPSVRTSFKEAITPHIVRRINAETGKLGGSPQGLAIKRMATAMAPRLVDQIVGSFITPKGLARLAASGGNIDLASAGLTDLARKLMVSPETGDGQSPSDADGFFRKATEALKDVPGAREALQDMARRELSPSGSPGHSEPKDQVRKDSATDYGINNIKTIRFNSPTEFELGIAKVQSADNPDLTLVMGFQKFDWKLIKLIPHLK